MRETSSEKRSRGWLPDIVVGGGIDAVLGAIAAVNVVIIFGPDDGYESSLSDVFEHSVMVGLLTVSVLRLFPIAGVWLARKRRRVR